MSLKDMITVAGFVLTAGSMVSACVWTVSRVKSTADSTARLLGKDIQHLTSAIEGFRQDLNLMRNDQHRLSERVVRLEERDRMLRNEEVA